MMVDDFNHQIILCIFCYFIFEKMRKARKLVGSLEAIS